LLFAHIPYLRNDHVGQYIIKRGAQ
jgi:hypothetical protein